MTVHYKVRKAQPVVCPNELVLVFDQLQPHVFGILEAQFAWKEFRCSRMTTRVTTLSYQIHLPQTVRDTKLEITHEQTNLGVHQLFRR